MQLHGLPSSRIFGKKMTKLQFIRQKPTHLSTQSSYATGGTLTSFGKSEVQIVLSSLSAKKKIYFPHPLFALWRTLLCYFWTSSVFFRFFSYICVYIPLCHVTSLLRRPCSYFERAQQPSDSRKFLFPHLSVFWHCANVHPRLFDFLR